MTIKTGDLVKINKQNLTSRYQSFLAESVFEKVLIVLTSHYSSALNQNVVKVFDTDEKQIYIFRENVFEKLN